MEDFSTDPGARRRMPFCAGDRDAVLQARKQKVQRRTQEQASDQSSIREQLASCLQVSALASCICSSGRQGVKHSTEQFP